MRFLFFALLFTQFLFLSAATLHAEEADTKGEDKNAPQNSDVAIGDPKEIFLTKKAKQQKTLKTEKREEPKTMSEFLTNLKKDFKQVGKKLEGLKDELAKQQRHTFCDPDFTPPTRPDWR